MKTVSIHAEFDVYLHSAVWQALLKWKAKFQNRFFKLRKIGSYINTCLKLRVTRESLMFKITVSGKIPEDGCTLEKSTSWEPES